jgi:succinate dehydrogenase / fumarate reductase, iron-sulfur subunit
MRLSISRYDPEHAIMNCSEVCPKGLEPAHAIEMIRLKMLDVDKKGALGIHRVSPIR